MLVMMTNTVSDSEIIVLSEVYVHMYVSVYMYLYMIIICTCSLYIKMYNTVIKTS